MAILIKWSILIERIHMTTLMFPDDVAKRLEDFARRENRSVADVVAEWLDEHAPEEEPKKAPNWDLILGIGDENVTDMSTTVRETLDAYYKKKYANPD